MNEDISQEQAESIVKRIKKLMALSKSSNENESAAAAAKAQELLIKYNVEMSEIENTTLDSEDMKLRNEFIDIFGDDAKNAIQWKKNLAFGVARANLCRAVATHVGAKRPGMWFLGKRHNIEIANYMYQTVAADIIRIADEKWKQILALRDLETTHGVKLFTDSSLRSIHGKTWKASFYVGAVKTVRERLEENLNALQIESGDIKALVTTENQQLRDFEHQQFPHLVSSKPLTATYRSAYESGRAAGHQIQFKRGIGAGGVHSGPARLGDGK